MGRQDFINLAKHPVLVGGLLAGVLDLAAVIAWRGVFGLPPARLLQGTASGVLGQQAFAGGFRSAVLGLLLHFIIAFAAAGTYYVVSRVASFLTRRPILSGLLYGALVYFFMHLIVLPLSRVPFGDPPAHIAAGLLLIHMLFVGLPISLAVRHASLHAANQTGLPLA